MKKILLLFFKILGKQTIARPLQIFSYLTRRLATFAHKLQMKFEWKVPPQPEWFDHYGDQYYLFGEQRIPFWVERGVFGLLAMKQNAKVLELCCGDGYNSKHFYSIRAQQIIAVDFDQLAIPFAKRYNSVSNVDFRLCDIRYDMPQGQFDNIIWDAAIEHFTPEEIDLVLSNIKQRLLPNGIVTGYTLVEREDGLKHLSHHEYEFRSKEDLRRFFEPHFKNVLVVETIYPNRHNLYFFASDATIPFDKEWSKMTQFKHS